MGLLSDIGAPGVESGVNFSGFGLWALIIFAVFLVMFVAGGILIFHYSRKIAKKQFNNKIPIFVKIHGKLTRIGIDDAKELFVPDSNISLFFLKRKKIYIARPTRNMGKNEFWYYISENGEWVNFDLSSDPDKNVLAIANYDHRDTRYAFVNLTDIIKKNYKDKSVKWWKEYSPLITFIVIAIIFVAGCWFLIARIGQLITALGPIADKFQVIADSLGQSVKTAQNINSGIVPAG